MTSRKLLKTTEANYLSGKKLKKTQEVTVFLFSDCIVATSLRSKKGATDRTSRLHDVLLCGDSIDIPSFA